MPVVNEQVQSTLLPDASRIAEGAAHRRAPFAAFLFLLALYLLTASGHLYSPDEEAMYYVTRGLATRGDIAIEGDDLVPMPLREGRDGRSVSPYGILPSLAALPFFALGALLAGGASVEVYEYLTRFTVSLLNAPVTAATGAILFSFVVSLGYGRQAAWLAAGAFGVASLAWPYARTFFSEPLAGFLLILAVERAYSASMRHDRRALLISGVATGLLVATRLAALVAVPFLMLYVAAATVSCLAASRGMVERCRGMAAHLGLWSLGLVPGVALVIGYNLARFGSPLASGYGDETSAFTTPLLTGLTGLLLSPGKSLFLYAPVAAIGAGGRAVAMAAAASGNNAAAVAGHCACGAVCALARMGWRRGLGSASVAAGCAAAGAAGGAGVRTRGIGRTGATPGCRNRSGVRNDQCAGGCHRQPGDLPQHGDPAPPDLFRGGSLAIAGALAHCGGTLAGAVWRRVSA
jgi:hypothetical protein